MLRADRGFCDGYLMAWCEQNHVDYTIDLARNQRLRKIIGKQILQAHVQHQSTGNALRFDNLPRKMFTGENLGSIHTLMQNWPLVTERERINFEDCSPFQTDLGDLVDDS